jgi:hypothetical protein
LFLFRNYDINGMFCILNDVFGLDQSKRVSGQAEEQLDQHKIYHSEKKLIDPPVRTLFEIFYCDAKARPAAF